MIEGFLTALVFLAVASYYDIFNRRVIPDWVSYSFIVVALIFSIIYYGTDFARIGIALLVFVVGYLIYRMGYLGGADVFFLSGIMLTLPLSISGMPTILIVLLASTIIMAIYLEVSFLSKNRVIKPRIEDIATSVIWIIGYAIVSYMLYSLDMPLLALVAVVVGICSALFALIKRDLTKSLITWVKPDEIIEEDILATDEMDKKIVERYNLERLLTKEMIARIKRARIRIVPIYGKLPPYIPFLMLGVIVALAIYYYI
ncbi:MAG: A24 family peptidase [Candidatus Micrarchaeia archaeon]